MNARFNQNITNISHPMRQGNISLLYSMNEVFIGLWSISLFYLVLWKIGIKRFDTALLGLFNYRQLNH